MDEQLKSRVISWVKENEDSYRRDCGSAEYRSYLTDDAIAEFGSWQPAGQAEQLRDEIAALCFKICNGDL